MERLLGIANEVLGTALPACTECIEAPIELPNFASATLTMRLEPSGCITIILEKEGACISGTFPLDGAVDTRVRTFLGAWNAVGMVSDPLGAHIKAVPACSTAATILHTQKRAPYQPDLQGKHGLGGTQAHRPCGPLDLEQGGNLIGLDHSMFKEDEEQKERPGNPFNPFDLDENGTRRPRHLPPGARWEPARPRIKDPLQSGGGLPYI